MDVSIVLICGTLINYNSILIVYSKTLSTYSEDKTNTYI